MGKSVAIVRVMNDYTVFVGIDNQTCTFNLGRVIAFVHESPFALSFVLLLLLFMSCPKFGSRGQLYLHSKFVNVTTKKLLSPKEAPIAGGSNPNFCL